MLKSFSFLKIFLIFFIFIIFIEDFNKKSYAVEPEEFLENPISELRARNISKEIRCMVCQNQSIDDSSAPLAKDLRILIRKKINENATDKEIFDYLTERYGDFILLKPPLKITTLALWLFPFIFCFIGILILLIHNKKSYQKLDKR
tara:strand:+ start:1449 stop:1886 length:438 start_codon:yes stop_codon:yes gene_type:complete